MRLFIAIFAILLSFSAVQAQNGRGYGFPAQDLRNPPDTGMVMITKRWPAGTKTNAAFWEYWSLTPGGGGGVDSVELQGIRDSLLYLYGLTSQPDTAQVVIYKPAHGQNPLLCPGGILPLTENFDAATAANAQDLPFTYAIGTRGPDSLVVKPSGFLSRPGHGLTVGQVYYQQNTPCNLGLSPGTIDAPVLLVIDLNTIQLIDRSGLPGSDAVRIFIPTSQFTSRGADPRFPTDSIAGAIATLYQSVGLARPGAIFVYQLAAGTNNPTFQAPANESSTPFQAWFWDGLRATRISYGQIAVNMAATVAGAGTPITPAVNGTAAQAVAFLDNNCQRLPMPNGTLLYWIGDGTENEPDTVYQVIDDPTRTGARVVLLKSAGSGISSSVFYNRLSYKLTAINTKADFKSIPDSVFTVGDIVRTRGYATPGDQGGAEYLIQTDTIAGYAVDGIAVIQLAVGKYAVLQGEQGFNAAAFGMSTTLPDNSTALQKAIDFTILTNSGGVSVLHLPAGEYTLTKGVYIWGNGFKSMTLSGATPAYSGTQSIGKTTGLYLNCNQCFAIGIERARNIEVKNISIRGNGVTPPGETFVNVTEATWGGLSNDRYSPNAGIVIDPFSSSTPGGNQYPGYISQYASVTGLGGSSHVLIQGCSFYSLGTAICCSPNGTTQNGDNVRAENISAGGCRYFWSTSQTQAKGNSISNVYIVGRLLAFVVANAHGAQNGKLPDVSNFNIASGVKYLSLGGIFRGTYLNGFSEGVVSLGNSNLNIDNCQFNFNQDSDRLPTLFAGSLLRVTNSILNYYNNCGLSGIYPMYFSGKIEMRNTSVDGAILVPRLDASGSVSENFDFDDLTLQCKGSSYKKIDVIETTDAARPIVVDLGASIRFRNSFQDGRDAMIVWLARSGTLTVDTLLKTGRVVMSNPSQIATVGSIVMTLTNINYSNDVFPSERAPIGIVTSIVSDTIFFNRVPLGATNVTGNIYIGNYNLWSTRIIGTTISGQSKIVVQNNVEGNTSTTWLAKGPFLVSGPGIPAGTLVTNWIADTVFLSQNATASNTSVVFGGSLGQRKIYGTSPTVITNQLVWNIGDELINSTINRAPNSPSKWICTVPGVRASAIPPSWRAVYDPVSGNSTIATDASGDVIITHGFGGTPNVINVTPVGNIRATLQATSSTTFTVRCYDGITGAPIASTPVTFYWNAQ